tara:strand:- start:2748 stop:3332 length:585 start_codon:yes stop_codon:yes gene_type:complete
MRHKIIQKEDSHNKNLQRQEANQVRGSISAKDKLRYAKDLRDMKHNYISEGNIVAGYYPIGSELNILPLLNQLSKKKHLICLPCINGSSLEFRSWGCGSRLQKNRYSIPEPIEGDIMIPDIVYVPGLFFCRGGNRIGYGGGYYDKTISKYRRKYDTKFVGVCYPIQVRDNIAIDEYDEKVDIVIDTKTKYDLIF